MSFGAEAGQGGGEGRVIRVGGDEFAERLDGGVLLALGPLAVGEQDHGAAGGLGVRRDR